MFVSEGRTGATAAAEEHGGARVDLRTPVTVLTGFLGSGKTTLLNRALGDPAMAGTAVVINEFGEIGIDHALMTASDDTVTILDNGCLCCTVFGDLVTTLNSLHLGRETGKGFHFSQVVIETSGLVDPTPVAQAFLSDPILARLYRLAAIVAVVDAVNGAETLERHQEAQRQVALADRIVITKADLVPPSKEREDTLVDRLRGCNPVAQLSFNCDPDLDPAELLRPVTRDPREGGAAALEWLALEPLRAGAGGGETQTGPHRHGGEAGRIATYCLVREHPLDLDALHLLLTAIEGNLGRRLLRVKGLVNVADMPGRPAIIQGAQHLLHNLVHLDRWPDADERTRVVFIVQDMPSPALEEMVTTFERIAGRNTAIRSRVQKLAMVGDADEQCEVPR